MKRYVLTLDAEQDVTELAEYIARDDTATALRILDEIDAAALKLARFPHLGHERKDITSRPVRFWPLYSFVIVYRPDTTPLEIVRVVSAFRDLVALLA